VAKALTATAALTALAVFRLGRVVLGTIGLWQLLGPVWAVAGLAALILLRFTLPVRIGVVLAAVYLWSLPWMAALLARLRHPRPVWRGIDSAST